MYKAIVFDFDDTLGTFSEEIENSINSILYPEVIQILKKLKEENYKLCLVTTKFHHEIDQILNKVHCNKLFDVIADTENVKMEKPAPEGLLKVIEYLKLNKNDVLYVGDSPLDAKMAQSAAVKFAGVLTKTTSKQDFADYNAEFIGDTIIDLYDYLQKCIPFWEETYQNYDDITFSREPNPTVKEYVAPLKKQSRILEVGCGEGQNSIYLAKQGYTNVDAFDVSQNGINKMKELCRVNHVAVNAFVDDLTTYQFTQKYDLIMSFGTLHFVNKEDWKQFIIRAKENTNPDGIHIMQIFTDKVPASADIALFAVGLAKDEEIKELYQDWEILQFNSYVFEDEHPGVPKHLHASNKIVAKKKA